MVSLGGGYRLQETEKIRLPKGHYWAGCMAYALSEEEEDELSHEWGLRYHSDGNEGGKYRNEGGKFTLSTGRVVVAFLCDGTINWDCNEYPFDIEDGTLVGITKLKGLELGQQYREHAGRVVHYHKPFNSYTSTCFNTRRDERMTNIYFGDKVDICVEGGRWDEGDPDDSDASVDP
jgi:hypothetical protein